MVALDMKYPEICGECQLWHYDEDGCHPFCTYLDREIKDLDRKLRGCPIKGKVNKSDVIKEKKGK